jgi:hypothetical protein
MRWLLLLGLCGCDQTSLLLDLRLAPGMAQPGALQLSLYHAGLLHRSTVPTAGRMLPGSLILQNVPPGPALRVQVDGLDGAGKMMEQAAEVVDITGGAENRILLTLGPPLNDADGDGVPDVVDDCPERPDPDQRCAATADMAHPVAADLSVPPGADLAVPPGADLSVTPLADLARPVDLAGVDLAGADLATPACPADAILCDDFETGNDSRWNAGIEAPKPEIALTIDTTRPHAGVYALHANVTVAGKSGTYNRVIEEDLQSLAPPWGLRFFMYSVDTVDNFTLVAAFSNNSCDYLSIGGGMGVWTVSEVVANGPSTDHLAAIPVAVGQWTCVELYHDGTQIHLYTDKIERVVFAPSLTRAFDTFGMGLPRWPADRDNELFFDDFILAKSRVGCP